MFLLTFLVMNTGETEQELETNVFQASSIAQKYNCNLRRLDFHSPLTSRFSSFYHIPPDLQTEKNVIQYSGKNRPAHQRREQEVTTMEKIRLGRTDLWLTKTSFGALPIQRISKEDAVALVRRAYDSGINYFDTIYKTGGFLQFLLFGKFYTFVNSGTFGNFIHKSHLQKSEAENNFCL